jgi:hypothetical protein
VSLLDITSFRPVAIDGILGWLAVLGGVDDVGGGPPSRDSRGDLVAVLVCTETKPTLSKRPLLRRALLAVFAVLAVLVVGLVVVLAVLVVWWRVVMMRRPRVVTGEVWLDQRDLDVDGSCDRPQLQESTDVVFSGDVARLRGERGDLCRERLVGEDDVAGRGLDVEHVEVDIASRVVEDEVDAFALDVNARVGHAGRDVEHDLVRWQARMPMSVLYEVVAISTCGPTTCSSSSPSSGVYADSMAKYAVESSSSSTASCPPTGCETMVNVPSDPSANLTVSG